MNSSSRSENNKQTIDYISYVYALIILIGGAIGFIKAGI
jgi:hypothetical protein